MYRWQSVTSNVTNALKALCVGGNHWCETNGEILAAGSASDPQAAILPLFKKDAVTVIGMIGYYSFVILISCQHGLLLFDYKTEEIGVSL